MIANPLGRLTEERTYPALRKQQSPHLAFSSRMGFCLCDREIYECLSGSFPTFYLVVSGKKRNFAAKLDVEL
jgi:hypothetical protein